MTYETLKATCDERGVYTICLNRPDIRNAFNEKMIEELTHIFSKEVFMPEVRIIVLRGEGGVFCAGGDLNWMKKSIQLDRDGNLKDTRVLTHMFHLMNVCPKPLVGAIHGAAIGGGVGLVSVCDFVIATVDTQLSLSEVRLGIVPACIGPFVVAKIGASYARAMFISAERFLATRAHEMGLVHTLVADMKALDIELERMLENMLLCGPNAMAIAKKLVLDLSWPERREALGDTLDHVARVLADLRVSPEGQEGLKAFLEKRTPAWVQQK